MTHMLSGASIVSLKFVFVVRVRVRSGILDHVCTDTITRMALAFGSLSSLQDIFQQSNQEDFYEQSIGARRDLLQRYQ
jgi:hypothetical protein